MDRVAILRKACFKKGEDILGDILAGRKTIESRWYVNKVAPWDNIHAGDTVYFKESSCPVTAKTRVGKVLQFDGLTAVSINEIVTSYGKLIDPNISEDEFTSWCNSHPEKRYCILVFLEHVEKIGPFEISKQGFGISSAWLVVGDINRVRM